MKSQNIQSLVKEISDSKRNCYFISPHIDDAVFSAGALIIALRKKNVPVTIINVFTKGGSRNTLSARKYLAISNAKSAKELFNIRIVEERQIAKKLGINIVNLGFVDALWRMKSAHLLLNKLSYIFAELTAVYPTYKYHITSGILSKEDSKVKKEIQKKLSMYISKKSYVFAPLAIGNHVDHVLIREATNNMNPIYWKDFPYSLNTKSSFSSFNNERIHRTYICTSHLKEKDKHARMYVNQAKAYPALSISKLKETFYRFI